MFSCLNDSIIIKCVSLSLGVFPPLEFYLLFLISWDGIQMSPGHMRIIGIILRFLLGFYFFKNDLSLILQIFTPLWKIYTFI